jgi:hypothetical protein
MSRSPNLRLRWIHLSLLACIAAVSGCASVEANKAPPDLVAKKPAADKAAEKPATASVAAMRDERRKTVVSEFERERDRAQYQAH